MAAIARCKLLSVIINHPLHIRHFAISTGNISKAALLRFLQIETNPERILKVWRAAALAPRSQMDRLAYSTAILNLRNSNHFGAIREILEEYQSRPDLRSEKYISHFILLYGEAGMLDDAMKTFEKMEDMGIKRSAKSLNSLLFACLETRNFEEMKRVFFEFPKKYRIAPNLDTYDTMIKVLSESGCTSSVYPILDEMIKNKLWPKGTTFPYCLVGFLKEEKDTDIRKVWDIMSRHFASPGTVDLYVSMIDFYFALKKSKEAKALLDEILSTDLKPNASSHLIHVFCKEGDMEAAKSVFEKMVSSYINSKNRLFSLISDGGDREDTAKITYECMEKIWVPNFLTMKMLVDGLVSISKVREANEIIAHLKRMFPRNADKWIEIGEGLPKKYYDEIKPWDLMPNWFSYADITYPTLFRNKTA